MFIEFREPWTVENQRTSASWNQKTAPLEARRMQIVAISKGQGKVRGVGKSFINMSRNKTGTMASALLTFNFN
jgi:hypothetical protein